MVFQIPPGLPGARTQRLRVAVAVRRARACRGRAVAVLLSLALHLAGTIAPAHASDELTLEAVLDSSLTHFPRIQSAVQETLARQGKVTAAMGAFDLALEQESLIWADGFFDGLSADTRLAKRLPQANAKVFAGYRVTNDDFPIYQQEVVTNSGGEFNIGVVFSLWRDRAIDSDRFKVLSERLGVRDAEIDLMLAKVMTQRNAASQRQ